MKKRGYFLIVLITVVITTALLYFYDRYYRHDIATVVLQRTSFWDTFYRNKVNEDLSFERQTAITRAVSVIAPTVVSVNVWKQNRHGLHPFHEDWILEYVDEPLTREVQNIGSGVLFTNDGYIITNAHVIENAIHIKVVLHDAVEYDASLIGVDSVHDIAIIKIDSRNLPYAILGTSSDLMVGEWSIAVGNPYGFLMKDSKPSVSVGVISAANRNFIDRQESRIFRGMIQTDAAINPGNSGGPLVNIYGEVIGINTFLLTDMGTSVGVGFAIPIDRVKKIAEELITYGRTRGAYLGFMIQEITPFIASYLHLRNLDGVIISTIDQNGPAQNAGLRRGDIITMINEINIRDSSDVEIGVSDTSPGDTLSLRIIRDGREVDILLAAGEYR